MMKILHIEDSPLYAEFVRQLLPAHEIHLATTGADAVRAIRRHKYDLVICDYYVPGVTNGELIEIMRCLHSGRLVAYTIDRDRARAASKVDGVTWLQKGEDEDALKQMGGSL